MAEPNTYGYNQGKIEELRDPINQAAKAAARDIVETLESEIVQKMKDAWYAEEAVEFFGEFKNVVASCGETIHNAFNEFRRGVQEAGEYWATETKGTSPTLAYIDQIELDLNVGDIQAFNSEGDRALNENATSDVIRGIPSVRTTIATKLGALEAELNATTSFLGGNQAQNIQTCFGEVLKALEKIFKFLNEGENSLMVVLEKYKVKYAKDAEEVSTAFQTTSSAE